MGDDLVISTADAPCGCHAFQHNFQVFIAQRCALYRKFLVSLESPDRHSLLVAVKLQSHWSALNTPKDLDVSTAKIQRIKVRWSCRPVELASTSYPPLTKSLVELLSENVEKTKWFPIIHEPYVFVGEEAHALGILVNHSHT
jgi:hypothetical protein